MRLLDGPVPASGYWWYRVSDLTTTLTGGVTEGWIAVGDTDGTPWIAPSAQGCLDWPFAAADITVDSLSALQAEFEGTWGGCVVTPWLAPYPVIVTFRGDGTYSATGFAPTGEPAFYYGTDEDSPQKRYALNDLLDNQTGVGQIDIVFGTDNTNRGDLRNVRLMGDQLEFEFFHRGDYGPLTFRVYRIGD